MTRVKQRQKWREGAARYRKRHPGRATKTVYRWRRKHPQRYRRQARKAQLRYHPAKMLVNAARRRAKNRGMKFTITWRDLMPLPKICPVFGCRLDYGPGRGRSLYENGRAASLDRIENRRGYVPSNILVVSLRANLLKGQASLAELQKIAKFYRRYVS